MRPGRAARAAMLGALAAAAMALMPLAAQGEDLVSGLSQDQIEISSNYTGTDLVVFGAIRSPQDNLSGEPDVVVLLRGPDVDMTVRRKERVAGLWINRHEVRLTGMPGYYYIASTRPLGKIASDAVLDRYDLGLKHIEAASASTRKSPRETAMYTEAAIRQEARAGLYKEVSQGVEFLSVSLFRVRIPVPAAVPRGRYTAEVLLFQKGNVVAAQSTPLFVDQIGLERRLFTFAHTSPLAYGVSTVAMALLLGWLSSVVFRRR